MCERLYMEDFAESRMARSSFAGGTSMFNSQMGASSFGPSYKSMLGDDAFNNAAQAAEGPKTVKIGNEVVTMPEKKSLKKVNEKKKAKTQAQLEREKEANRKKRKAALKAAREAKQGKKDGVSAAAADGGDAAAPVG